MGSKSIMKPVFLAALAGVAVLLGISAVHPASAQDDESASRAHEIAKRTIEAMGGEEAWNETRYLVWEWRNQTHYWDKWSGDFRWERDSLTSILNVNTREGRYWIDGAEVTEPDTLEKLLEDVYWRWVNNSYWLVMPYKLLDPGVNLRYLGEKESSSGEPVDVIEMTFENVGLTPRNKYEVMIDTETGLVCEWSYYRDRDDPEPQFTRLWIDWKTYDGVMLASGRGDVDFNMTGVRVPDELPDGIFEDLRY